MEVIRVFLVDDRADIRASLSEYLESYNDIDVVGMASSGEEALQQLASGQAKADIVVVDVNMPGIDGFDTTKELQRYAPNLPVVLCSLSDSADVRATAQQVGAAAFVSKFDLIDQLPKVLRHLTHSPLWQPMPLSA